jgi:hypothetical protein
MGEVEGEALSSMDEWRQEKQEKQERGSTIRIKVSGL